MDMDDTATAIELAFEDAEDRLVRRWHPQHEREQQDGNSEQQHVLRRPQIPPLAKCAGNVQRALPCSRCISSIAIYCRDPLMAIL